MAEIIYLLRHAAPPPERQGRYWGKGDPGVDAGSLAQAAALAPLLWRRPERLLCSPLRRAYLTARQLQPALRLPIEFAPELAEADFGCFDGLNFTEIGERHPEAAARWAELLDAFAFPGGESIAGFLRRAADYWRRCLEMPETAIMAVAHAGVISAWAALFCGLPPARRFAFRPEYSALTAFVRKQDGSGWVLRFFNNRM